MAQAFDKADMQSGKLTWMLNGGSENVGWHQQIGSDNEPVLTGTAVVYRNGTQYCPNVIREFSYSNENIGVTYVDGGEYHKYSQGDDPLCEVCQTSAFYDRTDGKVSLNTDFRAALNANTDYVYNGVTYWQQNTPLPNPAPNDGYYKEQKITSLDGLFGSLSATNLDISRFDTRYVTSFAYLFNDDKNLQSVNVAGL